MFPFHHLLKVKKNRWISNESPSHLAPISNESMFELIQGWTYSTSYPVSHLCSPPHPHARCETILVQACHVSSQIQQFLIGEGYIFRRGWNAPTPLCLALTSLTICQNMVLLLHKRLLFKSFHFVFTVFGCSYQNKTHIYSRVRSAIAAPMTIYKLSSSNESSSSCIVSVGHSTQRKKGNRSVQVTSFRIR